MQIDMALIWMTLFSTLSDTNGWGLKWEYFSNNFKWPCYLLFQKRKKEKRNIKSISGKFFNFRAITAEMHQISNQFFCMSLWFGTVVELSFFGHFSWTKPGLTAMFHGLHTSIFVFWKGWFKDFEVTNLPLASGICGKQFHELN